MTGRPPSYTPEQRDEVLRLRREDRSHLECAQATGLSRAVVINICRKAGVLHQGTTERNRRHGRPPNHTAEQRAEMRRLWAANPDRGQPGYLSLAQIGERTGGWTAKVVFGVLNPGGRVAREEWEVARQPFGPEEHKRARNTLGLRHVDDLLALTRKSDPFYCGYVSQNRDAQWFGRLRRDLGFPDDSHLRRVHYKADAVGVPKPGGTPYKNNTHDWKMLLDSARYARMLAIVDVETVGDRRGRPLRDNVQAWAYSVPQPGVNLADEEGEDWEGWAKPELKPPSAELALPEARVGGYEYNVADEPVLLEVWAEKSTMDDILVPLCERLGVNYVSGTGFESFHRMVTFLRRAEAYPTKRGAVLYISDHDKAGKQMPVQVSRQLQFFAVKLGIDAVVFVEPAILTAEQVEFYGLPEAPQEEGSEEVKTELDALEALHPGELERIVR